MNKDSMWGMNDRQTVSIVIMSALGLMMVCGGCASMQEAWMKGYVAVHEAADAALSNKPPAVVSVLTNSIPTVKPEASAGCGCDLSKPLALFASPVHGLTEKEVGEGWLRPRWASGTDDSCGGLPHDVRPRALTPSGKSFGWKYAITKGAIKIRFEGNQMAISCGDVTVDGMTQRWHFVGTSDHTSKEGWKDCKAGELTPIRKHAWFEVRSK